MSDLKRVVAFVFRRRGTDRIPKDDFHRLLSFDLKWFSPQDARRLLDHAIAQRVLRVEGDDVAPGFDPVSITVPLNWKPTTEVFEETVAADVLQELVGIIAHTSGLAPTAVTKAVEDMVKRAEGLLLPEAAAVLVARERGVPVEDLVKKAEAAVLRSASG